MIDFYLNDKYSGMQPGMKDFVSVKVAPGEKKIKLKKTSTINYRRTLHQI